MVDEEGLAVNSPTSGLCATEIWFRGQNVKSRKVKQKLKKVDESKVDGFFDRAVQGIHCSWFCGGSKCKHENWNLLSESQQKEAAIDGLNSTWVTTDVIASQRPSTSLFLKYLLIQQFKNNSVSGVFNLQEKGEHASCGPDGIYASSGYSYDGENDLMRYGIHYYEFPWPDMTAPPHEIVLRSVQVMDFHVKNNGKILVHCHAGLGRTGLMIACYLVYSQHISSTDAIELVRLSRPGAIQTSRQSHFVHSFEQYLWKLTQTFRIELSDSVITLDMFLQRQRLVLHGEQGDLYRYVPMHIHVLLCRIINLTKDDSRKAIQAIESLSPSTFLDTATLNNYRRSFNQRVFNARSINDIHVLSFLVGDWFRSMSVSVLSADDSRKIIKYQMLKAEERPDLPTFICEFLQKPVRHTVGMVISAASKMAKDVPILSKERALRHIANSFFEEYTMKQLHRESGAAAQIYNFFQKWEESIGALYFDYDSVPIGHRTIGRIALASSIVLEETET